MATGFVDDTRQITLRNRTAEVPGAPLLDRCGGLWVTWIAQNCMCLTGKMARYSVAQPMRELVANIATGYEQAPLLAGDFAYVGSARFRITDGSLDAGRHTATEVLAIDRGYAYARTSTAPTQSLLTSLERRRAPLEGSGVFDAWSVALPETRLKLLNALVPLSPVGHPDAVGVITFDCTLNASGAFGLMSRGEIATTDLTVIEYYVPLLERFFITGRKDEQDALELYPRNCIRAGMSCASKSGRYRDAIVQPVCRFYSAPARGGSHTHFYGSGSDCAALNKSTMLQYEGFDFSVRQPRVDVNKEALCPNGAPFAMIRLDNNKAGSNENNRFYASSPPTTCPKQAG